VHSVAFIYLFSSILGILKSMLTLFISNFVFNPLNALNYIGKILHVMCTERDGQSQQ
jgi:hypothetical protein